MDKYYYNLGTAFIEAAKRYAQCSALKYMDRNYSYLDLLSCVDQLTSFLIVNHLQRGDVIVIGNNKSFLSYALMLAALRLGIAYVNIDVSSPISRNLCILECVQPSCVFYDGGRYEQNMQDLITKYGCKGICLLPETFLLCPDQIDHEMQQCLMQKVDGACIAYIMFTSGSSGAPKGVAVTHQNVLHLIAWGRQYFRIGEQDNFAHLSPMYFDNSVFDFYVGLYSGASLSPIDRDLLTSPYSLVNYIDKLRCTIWFSVPSLLIYLMSMKALTIEKLSALRLFIFGGEGYPKIELKRLYDLFANQAQLVNVYGPTECTCISSAYILSDIDFEDLDAFPPLGQLNDNFDYCILDDEGKNARFGELCLMGPNVAAGYFNDLELSKKVFLTMTTPQRFMKQMYKTGDIVREEKGILYFIGRKDNQVKHMGYRIELEEIELALMKLRYVNQAAVIYQRVNTAYGKIIGYVASLSKLDEQALLCELSKILPDYMLPHRIITQAELPKNINGKVDKQGLRLLHGN